MLQSRLLSETVHVAANQQLLILNSAANPFVPQLAQQAKRGQLLFAEDNLGEVERVKRALSSQGRFVPFHNYFDQQPPATIDVAILDLLYQPGNAWMYYAVQVALYALRPGGQLYVVGAKDRGILSVGKRMLEYFGNLETLTISKGHRVLSSVKDEVHTMMPEQITPPTFAGNQLDAGTQLLLETLEVRPDDQALDIGCGAGLIGLAIARRAPQGMVTMVDASLAAVAASQHAIEESGLTNLRVLPGDGAQPVLPERFTLVATNPPFHQGGVQTTAIAERFMREAAQVLLPQGRFYLVANRFLKYEPVLQACFRQVDEVAGNSRYKVLLARN
ncbi:methyltransferase [Tengunoibacter tsumagoiensis]|uniref:Ribosomal RNA small subunit methyltransferase C n=1 Tax=Tengunoibacter tsumagoiensis TaxID=2014871 RepID=A0A401ZV21_9CHLR|nr:methyltransferase [Tengunoibacter tsumagoiensis]GCE10652.1 ribosomal RNA small subunit methyltransferase C [Tengunoibacter tsumagoiensis]